jgi:hypothetical protein
VGSLSTSSSPGSPKRGEVRSYPACVTVYAAGEPAVDAMEGRGILTVETRLEGDRVLVEIGDTGPGTPEAVAAHIFEPSTPPSRLAGAPAWASTSAGGSWCNATAAT